MMPSEGYVTAEDHVRLFFQMLGTGPDVAIVPNGTYLLEDFRRLAQGRTLIFYDLRNRGRSDSPGASSKLARGIHDDVDDLDAVRRHFGIPRFDLIGHSYVGITVVLCAMRYPAHVNRVVQIGPMQPVASTQYPAHLTGVDATLTEVFAKIAQLQKERQSHSPREFCRKFWAVLRHLYVTSPADADRINWGRCDLPNELNAMKYWTESILPSIQSLNLTSEHFANMEAPVLTIHGTRDRSAPYGGGREWALMLPGARLIAVDGAGHAPWIENSEKVFGSIETFLGGAWPQAAERVTSLDPMPEINVD